LIALSSRAEKQFDALVRHYEYLSRADAIQNLVAALALASDMIESDPDGGLPAPRPYPELAKRRRAWVKAGRYWVSYRPTTPTIITGIFFETANIPKRF
jgi:hypothetical protein